MTASLIYALIAVAILAIAWALVRQTQADETSASDRDDDYLRDRCDGPVLAVAEKLFDSGDFLWLRDEIGRPDLARALARSRQRLALRWLKAVKRSFDSLVRVPDPAAWAEPNGRSPSSWQLLWLTLRFHFLLGYAMLIVRLVGPYHHLVPSLGFFRPVSEVLSRKPRYRPAS